MIRQENRLVAKAGPLTVTVRLKPRFRNRSRARIRIIYLPEGGAPASKSMWIRFG
jgi:hypothetical protein